MAQIDRDWLIFSETGQMGRPFGTHRSWQATVLFSSLAKRGEWPSGLPQGENSGANFLGHECHTAVSARTPRR